MANGGEKNDFYAVLGLNKECTPTQLRTAYKKLAMRWHPDRCSAVGNSKFVEEAKKKFQAIQQAYSVLSDANKRFLYDVGAYDDDDDDDDENGMGDFINEMAVMMSQTKPSEVGEESLEELQELFQEMFQVDIDSFGSSSQSTASSSASSSFATSYGESSGSNKRNSSSGESRAESSSSFDAQFHSFCLGLEHNQDIKQQRGGRGGGAGSGSRRRNGRKQKVSSGRDVSSQDCGISAS